jgi:hypothetical protein
MDRMHISTVESLIRRARMFCRKWGGVHCFPWICVSWSALVYFCNTHLDGVYLDLEKLGHAGVSHSLGRYPNEYVSIRDSSRSIAQWASVAAPKVEKTRAWSWRGARQSRAPPTSSKSVLVLAGGAWSATDRLEPYVLAVLCPPSADARARKGKARLAAFRNVTREGDHRVAIA